MNANDALLSRICGQEETLAEARKLFPIATTRTKPGSGHDLGTLTTGLPAICAYIASDRLNNGDVSLDNARQASCLRPSDFNKALRIVIAALEKELGSRKGRREVAYDVLHEKYNVEMPFSTFSLFLRQAEHALVQLDAPYKVESIDVRHSIFFWASSAIQAKQLPTLDEFAQDNALISKRLAPVIKFLNDKCHSLKNKLVEATKAPSRPISPTKGSSPRTPRRSPTKPLRELPTRDSAKKRNDPTEDGPGRQKDADLWDDDMKILKTPIKKRKLDTLSPSSSSIPVKNVPAARSPFPSITPSVPRIAFPASPTKSKATNTPVISSPLRRSARLVLQEEVDNDNAMDVDEEGSDGAGEKLEARLRESSVEDDGQIVATRRFRPVYQDLKQWYSRDARVIRMWREAEEVRRNGPEVIAG